MIEINQQLTYTSKQNIGQHIASLLEDNELGQNSVVKNYFTTAADGRIKNSIMANSPQLKRI